MRLDGRILYLIDDPLLMRRQLNGEGIDAATALPLLRDDVSTDEMIPARHCLEVGADLADHCYRGLRSGDERPIDRGMVASGGFGASVAGARRGKGSSREHAPYAELHAGIHVVFASSFERIYRQNCHNLGLVTSTRLDLLPRFEAGEDIPLDELCSDVDTVGRDILAAGGLFGYTATDPVHVTSRSPSAPPRSLAGRILADHVDGAGPLRPVGSMQFFRTDLRYSHEYVTAMAATLLTEHVAHPELADPDTVLLFEDHLTALPLSPNVDSATVDKADALLRAQSAFAATHKVRLHGRHGEWSEGICHILVVERYAQPGQLIVGSDSHTCHVGALGCVAVGVGTTDLANAWVSAKVLLPVPRHALVRIDGALRQGVTEKDLMLSILAMPAVRAGGVLGAIVEFAGEAVAALGIDGRSTLTNMSAEMGALSGIVAPDACTARYLVERRGVEPATAQRWCSVPPSDVRAFDLVIDIDASEIPPMVSLPNDPGLAVPLADLGEEVRITRAYGGSCTAAKQRDMDAYAAVLSDALDHGRTVADEVEFSIQVGSTAIAEYCAERGYIELFEHAGARVLGPSCGACINAGPGASTKPTDVSISAQNRNFPGRSGPGLLYLASPLTVAASAVAGRIREFGSWG